MSEMQTSRHDAGASAGQPVNGSPSSAPGSETDAWWMPSGQAPQAGHPYGSPPPPFSAPHAAPYGVPPLGAGGPGWPNDHTSPLPMAPTPPSRRGASWRNRFLTALVLVAVAVGGGVTGAALEHDNAPVVSSANPTSGGSSAPTQPLAKVAAAVQPSVVSIQVTGSNESGEGSGVILRSDGTILTNNHVAAVAANGGSISVRFSDGKTASARILGRDPANDLAVIQAANVSGRTPATLGSADDLHVGDTVLAIGSPLGLEGSVSSGIVSALHRTVDLGDESQDNGGQDNGSQGNSGQDSSPFGTSPFGQDGSGSSGSSGSSSASSPTVVTDAIQTDAAINPGNSGGALVDGNGRVVGINTAIASLGSSSGTGQSGNIGVGFAIPIDQAKTIADELINGQTPSHAQLGISVSDATSGGAQVGEVTAGSGAAKAGLQTGDVVVQADSTPISDADALIGAVRSHKPGDTITLTYTRNGERRTATVTLGSSS